MSMPQQPHTAFKMCVRRKLCMMSWKVTLVCAREWDYSVLRAAELTGLSSFQKPRKPPQVQVLQVKYVQGLAMFFHLWEVVQIFQRESIICSKLSSGGSLFIEKLVPGGTNFGGSVFTMTGVLILSSLCILKPAWPTHAYFLLLYFCLLVLAPQMLCILLVYSISTQCALLAVALAFTLELFNCWTSQCQSALPII